MELGGFVDNHTAVWKMCRLAREHFSYEVLREKQIASIAGV